ncbi:LAME_0B03422g1_1 [Lachancea meyersii CBS 8951]|uniref:N-(5'-phosphoribosyl)anthranilate isomerase n=1 Tax=Lachancea meyersii CBS 8951 TaxID=1266667 RepID=A0A1G4IUP9_9SACH|nr:LAME_0B03422g1_1 [Lachancea meyersii CBS 8951]
MISTLDSSQFVTKICGLQSAEAAQEAIDANSILLGIICVPNRKRTVDPSVAKEISQRVKSAREERQKRGLLGPFLVGVFRNQSVEEVQRIKSDYGIDIAQLHGSENWQQYKEKFQDTLLIKRFVFPEDCPQVEELSKIENPGCLALFDSEAGGTGEKLDWDSISTWSQKTGATFILAGGLTPENVKAASQLHGVRGVDVSGGVETEGRKDYSKIKLFLSESSA